MSELLRVENLKKYFATPHGILHAVDDVSFSLEKGTTLGVVGESGCGKSTLGRTILKLHEPTSGKIYFEGNDITDYSPKEMKKMRQQMQIIFQDPFASLNPRMTVSETIAESLIIQKLVDKRDKAAIDKKVREYMDLVGIAERLVNSYPHELDGGRRQRIGIARALAMEPKLIICDEPVSALDVSIQAQILNLLGELQEKLGLTYIFITHDLSVVNHFSDEIAVMYLGQIVEKAPAEELFDNPIHPYTQALLSAIPIPELGHRRERVKLTGEITSPIEPPAECRFAKRCLYCNESICKSKVPELIEVAPNHFVACPLKQKELGFNV